MTLFEQILAVAERINDYQRKKNETLKQAVKEGAYTTQYIENMRQEMLVSINQQKATGKQEIEKLLESIFENEKKRSFSDLEVQNELTALGLVVDEIDAFELQAIFNRIYDNELLKNTLKKIAKKRNIELHPPKTQKDFELEKIQLERKQFFENWTLEKSKNFYELEGYSLLMDIEEIFEEINSKKNEQRQINP